MRLKHSYPTAMAFPAYGIGMVEPETPFDGDAVLLSNPMVSAVPEEAEVPAESEIDTKAPRNWRKGDPLAPVGDVGTEKDNT